MVESMEMLDGITAARALQRRSLNEAEGKRLLARFGIPVPRFVTVPDAYAVASAIDGLRGPFAVKVLSQDILHKSDAGGVMLGAADADAVRDAIMTIASRPEVRSARVDGYLVEEMCAPGSEIVIGAVRDRQFGPMIMVGLGGVFVEVLQDVAYARSPSATRLRCSTSCAAGSCLTAIATGGLATVARSSTCC